jgi:glycosyltransferase involved in cell wall biosynthesis
MNDVIAVVIGRHTEEPLIEGGGVIVHQTAKALSSLGIPTYLISLNYSKDTKNTSLIKLKTINKGSVNEITFKIGFLSQDDVLNNAQAMMISNFVEIITTPLPAFHFLKKLSKRAKHVFVFIANASKLAGHGIAMLSTLNIPNVTEVLMLFRRDELHRLTLRLLNPKIIFATSRELQVLAHKELGGKNKKYFFAYPPVIETDQESTNALKYKLSPIIMYSGRVSELRFPLKSLKEIALKLKESSGEIKLIIAFPPEKPSISWFLEARKIVKKLGLSNRVIFIPRILEKLEKISLLRSAEIFIYPAETTAAIEPPLSVLEAITFGQYLITKGFNSTRELVKQTAGQICKNFSALKTLDEYVNEAKRVNDIISQWASKNLSHVKFTRVCGNVIYDLL